MNSNRLSLRVQYWILTIMMCATLGLALEPKALAYVDPGSSLLIFQSLGALASGVLFYCRKHIKALFTRNSAKVEEPTSRTN